MTKTRQQLRLDDLETRAQGRRLTADKTGEKVDRSSGYLHQDRNIDKARCKDVCDCFFTVQKVLSISLHQGSAELRRRDNQRAFFLFRSKVLGV